MTTESALLAIIVGALGVLTTHLSYVLKYRLDRPQIQAGIDNTQAQANKTHEEATALRIDNAVDRLDLFAKMQTRMDELDEKLWRAGEDKKAARDREILLQAKVEEQNRKIEALQAELDDVSGRLRNCESLRETILAAVKTTAKDLDTEEGAA